MNLSIREINIEHAEAYRRLRLEALRSEPEAFAESPDEFARKSLEEIKDQISDWQQLGAFVIGAFTPDGILVGMVGVYCYPREKTRHRGKVWGVYITKEARETGLAKQLFTDVIERAKQSADLVQMELEVGADNKRAYRLYQSLGFVTCGEQPRALKIEDKYIDEHLMVLRLR
jgi:ribosomal protein S18 acetylase RimI-like enzyme